MLNEDFNVIKYIIVCIVCCSTASFATVYGAVKGQVLDISSDEPLIGVNITVEGTELGAATAEDGSFIIPFIPAGTYQITASYIGYNEQKISNVLVISDQTIVIDFGLEPTIIPVEACIVTAERPMVIASQTQTRKTVTAEEISELPLTEIYQIITLQAGVSSDKRFGGVEGGGLHVRGGRSHEIAYFIDGILAKAPHYGREAVNINKEAVEEIGIITGGFDAEYGEALSGIINVITREGKENISGLFRYTTDEIFTAKKLNYGYNLYEMSLGGSWLNESRIRYFFSGEAMLCDAWEPAKCRVPSERFDYKIQGKLSYQFPNARGKVSLSAFQSREQYMLYESGWGDLYFIFNLDHNSAETWKSKLLNLSFNYAPSAKSLIETKFGYTLIDRYWAARDLEKEQVQNRKWYDDYIFKGHHLFHLLRNYSDDDSILKFYIVDSLRYYYVEPDFYTPVALRNSPFSDAYFFVTVGDTPCWRYYFHTDYQSTFSYTQMLGKAHEFKTGINTALQNVGWYNNNNPWAMNPSWDVYDKNPVRGAVYVQDKMDFEGIIARLGLRLDYFDTRASTSINPVDPAETTLTDISAKIHFSPRLGFSLPITVRSKMRFNYGHFYQTPIAHDLYRWTNPMVLSFLRGGIVGNPNLTAEKTVAYELGYESQISEVLAFGFVAYYKDVYDLIQMLQVIALPYNYWQKTNFDYGNVKGIEFIIKKKLANYWNFDLSYTLQFARGTASHSWQFYYERRSSEYTDPISGKFIVPRIDYWLDFDQRHLINATVGFTIPQDFILAPIRDLSTDFILSYNSGFPYTPMDLKGQRLGDLNSARMPGFLNVDASLKKEISMAGIKFTVFSNIYNLFNTEQIMQVYNSSGKPDDDGGESKVKASGFSPIGSNSLYYSPQGDYNHDGLNSQYELYEEYLKARRYYYNNPFNWRPGFRMRVGIDLKFG